MKRFHGRFHLGSGEDPSVSRKENVGGEKCGSFVSVDERMIFRNPEGVGRREFENGRLLV